MTILSGVLQGTISVTGLQPPDLAFVTGSTFTTNASISGVYELPNTVTGGTFATSPELYGGAIISGASFKTTPTLTGVAPFTVYVTGAGFKVDPIISALGIEIARITGNGFTAQPQLYGGAIVSGTGFASNPVIFGLSSELAVVNGSGFIVSPVISGSAPEIGRVTGGTFRAELFYSKVTGGTFAVNPVIITEFTAEYAEAYVMNLMTNAVSRYESYPFSHIARINGVYYGVGSDGLYEFTGTTSGRIETGYMDFGTYQSKNTPYMYINGDDTYTVTPYVDSIVQPGFTSGFKGRRVKLARGNKGRYWSFKIEGINKLMGIEIMPDAISRRVK